ncbi:uncharacterized protein [Amphiura filiformis]|uniref:uncharacterized protein n=1 Tax=Amphiura filiformis TaxID=82378 RepID=UPI003B2274FF
MTKIICNESDAAAKRAKRGKEIVRQEPAYITEEMLPQLARLTENHYFDLAEALGFSLNAAQYILKQSHVIKEPATRMMLEMWWNNMDNGNISPSERSQRFLEALQSAGMEELARELTAGIIDSRDESQGISSEEECSDQSENGEEDRQGEGEEEDGLGKDEEDDLAGDHQNGEKDKTEGDGPDDPSSSSPLIRECPLCGNLFKTHLSGHLIRKHKIKDVAARRHFLDKARFRAQQDTGKGKKDKRLVKDCPIKGCGRACLKRLDKHLQEIHAIQPNTQLYREMIERARAAASTTQNGFTRRSKGFSINEPGPSSSDYELLNQFEGDLLANGDSERNARQTRNEVSKFVRASNTGGKLKLKNIFSVDHITDAMVNLKAANKVLECTLQHYINSCLKFLDFMLSRPRLYRQLGNIRRSRHFDATNALRRERKKLNKKVRTRIGQRKASIKELSITPVEEDMYRTAVNSDVNRIIGKYLLCFILILNTRRY